MTPEVIARVAATVRSTTEGLWEFGEQYAVLNTQPDFSYAELVRAVKEQHGVDLPPPTQASRMRKAYEKYVLECGLPIASVKRHSPYTLYELMMLTDITPHNAPEWLARAETTARDDLLGALKKDSGKPDWEHFRVESGVAEMMQQARLALAQSVGYEPDKMSLTVFLEFISELVINTDSELLLRLWRQMHGEDGE